MGWWRRSRDPEPPGPTIPDISSVLAPSFLIVDSAQIFVVTARTEDGEAVPHFGIRFHGYYEKTGEPNTVDVTIAWADAKSWFGLQSQVFLYGMTHHREEMTGHE